MTYNHLQTGEAMENILGTIREYQFNRDGILPISRMEAIALLRQDTNRRGTNLNFVLRMVRNFGPCFVDAYDYPEPSIIKLIYRSDKRYVLIRE